MSEPKNYQQLRSDLDQVLDTLQNGQVGLDEATELYEKGLKLVKELEKYLESAQNKVTKIKKSFSK